MAFADLLIINANVMTVDTARPRARAVAVAGNRILAVGDAAELAALRGAGTRVIDAQGAALLPGFNDSHIHIFGGGFELSGIDLAGLSGRAAFENAVRSQLGKRPGKGLLIANGADYTILNAEAVITRHDLDAVVSDRPFIMFAPDHHTAWANTMALEMGGLLKGKVVNPGNEVVMAADGLASGELREAEAISPVMALNPAAERTRLGLTTGGEPENLSAADRAVDRQIMRDGLKHLARHGITSFHNMDGNLYQLELLDEIDQEGGLTARGRVPMHFLPFMDISELDKAEEMARRYTSNRLSSGHVKMFMDGVIDSETAFMLQGYASRPDWRSDPLFDVERFKDICVDIDRRGLQIAVHAIGDAAVRATIDGYEAARKANGARDSRHRIEHIELIDPTDVPRIGELDILASMQPLHPPGNLCFPLQPFLDNIGEARWKDAFPWNDIRDTGAAIAFSSDWPVCPVDPLPGIQAAVTRKLWKAGLRDHRQTLDQAIAGFTAGGAYAEFAENEKGKITEGFLADLVLLSDNIETIDPEGIREMTVAATIFDGKVVYEA
ncbi:amidohydrolase [Oryzibacter oryziterrae]|uniref:amidohydrolase n=1 Tax=Oryzibacter oryziterrae TaxID=2766474 RepID=UPI001F36A90E|nr:amidohydrolase [Oryzibacter oryziterrae]